MYKLYKDAVTNIVVGVQKEQFGYLISVPFAHDNTDYQQFVRDIQNGVQLNDAEGNPITGSALTTFMETLP